MNETHTALGLCYVATPYSRYPAGIEAAFVDAAKLTAKLLTCGFWCYSPICHTHPLAIYGNLDPLDHDIWLPFDKAMMTAADSLLVAHMDGWDTSFGIAEEVKFFEGSGKPIYDLDPATLVMRKRSPREALIGHLAHGKTRREQGGAPV